MKRLLVVAAVLLGIGIPSAFANRRRLITLGRFGSAWRSVIYVTQPPMSLDI